ncbi:MAG: class I SAM-dependent methyltransferase [Crocosphaera sp.]|nr:class I SAM-dependent methyltransferase [Crocosphaera sp.]
MLNKITPQDFYNDFAPTYDATLENSKVNACHVKEAAKIFQRHNTEIHGSLLDLGCGTGLLKDLFQEREFDYTGIDISEKMLQYASSRGYKTIHEPIEVALPKIKDQSYDFVFALSSLLCIEDINSILLHIDRIARQSILLSIDNLTEEYIRDVPVTVYNHSKVKILNAKEDYLIRGWTSPTTGITIQTRMIYIEKV